MTDTAQMNTGAAVEQPLVVGLGQTGLSVARFFKRHGIDTRYADSRAEPPGLDELRSIDADAKVSAGKLSKTLLRHTSRLVVSPGIPDSDPFLVAARDAGIPVQSDIDLFVAEARAPYIAVTGSNGKSTVVTLLSLMCRAAGVDAPAGANLGTPALDMLDGAEPDFYILELSSFQLQRTSSLPARVAVLLNISPDHLDWHANEAEYRNAKLRIFREAEAAVYNRAEEGIESAIPADIPRVSFGLDEPTSGQYGIRHADGDAFLARGEQLLLSVKDVALVGRHNQANALAALAAGELLGLEIAPMLQVLHEFPGLPHRMQFIADVGGRIFINDSKATNVGAAVASVASVDGSVVLIAGGQGKGGDFDALARQTAHRLRAALLIGEDAAIIDAAFGDGVTTERLPDMGAAVRRGAEIAEPGDTVLLAPACASFDQYPNYQARGDDFCRAVRSLEQ